MSTKHSKAAEKFLQDSKMAAWHNETLWMVRAKRDKMSKEVPEWEELRNKACELKLYSNSHLEELLLEFEKNATANGAIVHWAKDADEYCAIVYEILNEHNVHQFHQEQIYARRRVWIESFPDGAWHRCRRVRFGRTHPAIDASRTKPHRTARHPHQTGTGRRTIRKGDGHGKGKL